MKKIVTLSIVIFSLSMVSCENNELNEQTGIELQLTDPGDDGTIDDDDILE